MHYYGLVYCWTIGYGIRSFARVTRLVHGKVVFCKRVPAIRSYPRCNYLKSTVIDNPNTCDVCDIGIINYRVEKNPVEYNGNTTELDMHYNLCNHCGCSYTTSTQSTLNKQLMVTFNQQCDLSQTTGNNNEY